MNQIILSEISEQWKQRLKNAGKVAGGAAALGAAGYGAYAADDKFNDGAATKAITNAAKSASNWASEQGKKLKTFFGKKEDSTTKPTTIAQPTTSPNPNEQRFKVNKPVSNVTSSMRQQEDTYNKEQEDYKKRVKLRQMQQADSQKQAIQQRSLSNSDALENQRNKNLEQEDYKKRVKIRQMQQSDSQKQAIVNNTNRSYDEKEKQLYNQRYNYGAKQFMDDNKKVNDAMDTFHKNNETLETNKKQSTVVKSKVHYPTSKAAEKESQIKADQMRKIKEIDRNARVISNSNEFKIQEKKKLMNLGNDIADTGRYLYNKHITGDIPKDMTPERFKELANKDR